MIAEGKELILNGKLDSIEDLNTALIGIISLEKILNNKTYDEDPDERDDNWKGDDSSYV